MQFDPCAPHHTDDPKKLRNVVQAIDDFLLGIELTGGPAGSPCRLSGTRQCVFLAFLEQVCHYYKPESKHWSADGKGCQWSTGDPPGEMVSYAKAALFSIWLELRNHFRVTVSNEGFTQAYRDLCKVRGDPEPSRLDIETVAELRIEPEKVAQLRNSAEVFRIGALRVQLKAVATLTPPPGFVGGGNGVSDSGGNNAYKMADLREMTSLRNATINNYARGIGLPIAPQGRGGCGFTWTLEQTCKLLSHIAEKSDEERVRNCCRESLTTLLKAQEKRKEIA